MGSSPSVATMHRLDSPQGRRPSDPLLRAPTNPRTADDAPTPSMGSIVRPSLGPFSENQPKNAAGSILRQLGTMTIDTTRQPPAKAPMNANERICVSLDTFYRPPPKTPPEGATITRQPSLSPA